MAAEDESSIPCSPWLARILRQTTPRTRRRLLELAAKHGTSVDDIVGRLMQFEARLDVAAREDPALAKWVRQARKQAGFPVPPRRRRGGRSPRPTRPPGPSGPKRAEGAA